MTDWSVSLANAEVGTVSPQGHELIRITDFMSDPATARDHAAGQRFAKVQEQYPGVRSPLPHSVATQWLSALAPMLDATFGEAPDGWEIQAWYSIVTSRPDELTPLQRLPHVDGTDPRHLAMMLYLHETNHGGTAFFRHRSTGYEALTTENIQHYAKTLETEVRAAGLPPAAYVTDGAPHFERTYASEGRYNEAIIYRGNLLHSGIIDNGKPLAADPTDGRLTVNAFFRPVGT